nr:hypothetical protein GCM10025732_48850 [Glycomyces mayteni]
MRVELLGPVRITGDDGAEIPVPAGRQRALLARLALDPGRHVTADALIAALWPDEEPANAAGALHTQLSRLRRVLGDRVVHGPGGYRLTRVDTDVEEFDRIAAQVEAASREDSPSTVRNSRTPHSRCGAAPRSPTSNGAGSPAPRSCASTCAAKPSRPCASRPACGSTAPTPSSPTSPPATPPTLGEPDAARYMRALAASGRRAEALAVYDQVRAKLADDLGVDPSPVLGEAHLDVLRGIEPVVPESRPNRLPQPLTACIGREAELAELPALLERHRLVTLTGPGGTGKTRLAVESAHRLAASGRTVRMVELAPVTDPGKLPEVVLDALGLTESVTARRSDDPATRLVEALWGRELVLVADNCEHVVEAAAGLIAHLLARVPALRVIATSREALGITGETVVGVGPSRCPRATRPGRGPRPRRGAPVRGARPPERPRLHRGRGQRRRRRGRLHRPRRPPLAIELAAARLRALSIDDLAARIGDRFGLLARGPRTAEPRQRTLRAVVDWSWDLLEPRERDVLARMSVFNGSADLDAACAVCSADADDIAGLVEKSLVQRLPGGRYRLLETVREYAAARLSEAGETAGRYERHAAHFADLAAEAEPHLMRAEQVEWLDRLALDHGNFTAAIRRMIAAGNAPAAYRAVTPLSWYWWMRGHRREGQELAMQVRAMPGEVEPLRRAEVVLAGTWGLWSGWLDPAEVEADFAAAQALCEEHDLYAADPLLLMIPLIRALLANDEDGLRAILAALDPERDAWVRGIGLLFASEYSERASGPGAALADLAEANRIFTKLGERFGLIITLQGLAAGRMAADDYEGPARC